MTTATTGSFSDFAFLANKTMEAASWIKTQATRRENQILAGAMALGLVLHPLYITAGAFIGYKGTQMLPDSVRQYMPGFRKDSSVFQGIQKSVGWVSEKSKFITIPALLAAGYFGLLPIFAKGTAMLAASAASHCALYMN